jgi:hypothetical protein
MLLNENDAYALIVESLRLKDVAGRLEVITGSLLVILNNGSKLVEREPSFLRDLMLEALRSDGRVAEALLELITKHPGGKAEACPGGGRIYCRAA